MLELVKSLSRHGIQKIRPLKASHKGIDEWDKMLCHPNIQITDRHKITATHSPDDSDTMYAVGTQQIVPNDYILDKYKRNTDIHTIKSWKVKLEQFCEKKRGILIGVIPDSKITFSGKYHLYPEGYGYILYFAWDHTAFYHFSRERNVWLTQDFKGIIDIKPGNVIEVIIYSKSNECGLGFRTDGEIQIAFNYLDPTISYRLMIASKYSYSAVLV